LTTNFSLKLKEAFSKFDILKKTTVNAGKPDILGITPGFRSLFQNQPGFERTQ
jgi:hypothetical protein